MKDSTENDSKHFQNLMYSWFFFANAILICCCRFKYLNFATF